VKRPAAMHVDDRTVNRGKGTAQHGTTSGSSSRSSTLPWTGVEEVRQRDDTQVAQFGGTRHEWDADITEQRPDERVA
jgi:hypothetical protein